ncbi:MAG: hypothetical protein U9R34_05380 [Nanoarchaeota archaeon]|nr:hypothetical protein [Nanoarchaeota archaeon]
MAKEKKRLVDIYSQMSSQDLMGKIDEWYKDEDTIIERQKKREDQIINLKKNTEAVANKYLLSKRGEDKKIKGQPKIRALDERISEAKLEAIELINTIALDSIKYEKGANVAKYYEDNPHHIREYLSSKRIDFEKLRMDLIRNRYDIEQSKAYKQYLEHIRPTLEEEIEENYIQQELAQGSEHYTTIKKDLNKKLESLNKKLGPGVNQQELFQHLMSYKLEGGRLSKQYMRKYSDHFKDYKKD